MNKCKNFNDDYEDDYGACSEFGDYCDYNGDSSACKKLKYFRGFVWSNKAWYAEANKIKNGLIHFGIYSADGGTAGEMSMEWMNLCEKNVPQLQAFDDSWEVLAGFKDVIDALGRASGKEITDADFVKILLDCGFTDRTEYTYSGDDCHEGD